MVFRGKICVVTGGAGGIGRAVAERFHGEGAAVAVIDRDEEAVKHLAARLGEDAGLFMTGDIAQQSTLDSFADTVLRRFGSVDVLVNNACITRRGILSHCGYDAFCEVLRVGVAAPYYLTMRFLSAFREGASVVNISSTRAAMSQPDTESYTAAKGGIGALTHALAVSLAGRVRVNSVSPGWIDTGAYHGEGGTVSAHSPSDRTQHPAGRVGVPEDIVHAVLFLCGSEAGFITGENITVDGGMSRLMIYHGDHGWTYKEEEK